MSRRFKRSNDVDVRHKNQSAQKALLEWGECSKKNDSLDRKLHRYIATSARHLSSSIKIVQANFLLFLFFCIFFVGDNDTSLLNLLWQLFVSRDWRKKMVWHLLHFITRLSPYRSVIAIRVEPFVQLAEKEKEYGVREHRRERIQTENAERSKDRDTGLAL